jgi:hypothetical protein
MVPGRKVIQLATLAFLFIGLVFTSTSALAYWRDVTVSRDVELVTIGEPVELLVTDINQGVSNLQLVPAGYAIAVGDVEEITLQYQIGVSRELLNAVDLYITVSDILVNNLDTYSHLVEIDIFGLGDDVKLDLYNEVLTIDVVVRLIEPIDAAEADRLGLDPSLVNVENSVAAYNELRGQNITFVLGFQIQPKSNVANN